MTFYNNKTFYGGIGETLVKQEKYDIVEKQYLCNVQLKQKGF